MQRMDTPFTLPLAPFVLRGAFKAYVDILLDIIDKLLAMLFKQKEKIRALDDELLVQKRQKKRPVFKGANLVKNTDRPQTDEAAGASATARRKRSERKPLKENEYTTVYVRLSDVPPGSVHKGYEYVMTQNVIFRVEHIRYARERFVTPEGAKLVASLPPEFAEGRFGAGFVSFVQGQYFDCQVSLPRITGQLTDIGARISESQVGALLDRGIDEREQECNEAAQEGVLSSPAVTVDDSDAPHMKSNGTVTNVSGPAFAYFRSGDSKSRLNFLEVLHAGAVTYVINDAALAYMGERMLSIKLINLLREHQGGGDLEKVELLMDSLDITGENNRRTITEAALWGALKGKLHPMCTIVSDGAQQFVLERLNHGLCWVHSERLIAVLVPAGEAQRVEQQRVRDDIWALFRALKDYKNAPSKDRAAELDAQFERTFTQTVTFPELQKQLALLYQHKNELLLALRRPDVPLHTNQSETDIRDHVVKRKISGRTRGPKGRRRRDVYLSLKKTCRKLGISFWAYLRDRISGANTIAPLCELIKARNLDLLAKTPLVLIAHPIS
jgi:hypothetical protein